MVDFYLDEVVANNAGFQVVANALAGRFPCIARENHNGKFTIIRLSKTPLTPGQTPFEFAADDNIDFLLSVHG